MAHPARSSTSTGASEPAERSKVDTEVQAPGWPTASPRAPLQARWSVARSPEPSTRLARTLPGSSSRSTTAGALGSATSITVTEARKPMATAGLRSASVTGTEKLLSAKSRVPRAWSAACQPATGSVATTRGASGSERSKSCRPRKRVRVARRPLSSCTCRSPSGWKYGSVPPRSGGRGSSGL
ncbi:MAG: hypothetical protein A2138_17260 [Deltaproteobacteria bacterium RBG_16_71_12]|nr:MAG: hypothetical protein A2138_17260 [Deltaproteobacteria bacterium RBG_16_71_12]